MADLDDPSSSASMPADASPSPGVKRKRAADPKFYAVRAGHRPGIYHSWSECLAQVKGFKGATFKSFPTLTGAERFLGGDGPSDAAARSWGPFKFYAVRSGRVPGIYTDWPSAQRQVAGWAKPKHKCFSTRAEAERFLSDDGQPADDSTFDSVIESREFDIGPEEAGEGPLKKQKKGSSANGIGRATKPVVEDYDEAVFEAGLGPLPPGAEDGFDPNILLDPSNNGVVYKSAIQRSATKLQAVCPAPEGMLRIFTDGSSLGNGQDGAVAGVGVYFGPRDARNISEALSGSRQTNQRAELTAIGRALDTVPKDRDVTIVTDSQYSINCITVWSGNWRRNGWKTAAGKTVENRDLVESIVNKIEDRKSSHVQTTFEWIKGHSNHPGNVEADKLAVNGARRAANLPR